MRTAAGNTWFVSVGLKDAARNSACRGDADIAVPDSPGRIRVIETREDDPTARETRRLVKLEPS